MILELSYVHNAVFEIRKLSIFNSKTTNIKENLKYFRLFIL